MHSAPFSEARKSLDKMIESWCVFSFSLFPEQCIKAVFNTRFLPWDAYMLSWVRSGDWLAHWRMYLISLPWKSLGLHRGMLWDIIYLHCGALYDQFCSICLKLSREYTPVHFKIIPVSINSHIINKYQWPGSTGSHTCLCHNIASSILGRWYDILQIMIYFSPLSFSV